MFYEPPEARSLVSEKLRMSVGLKLNDDISLNLIFMNSSIPFLGELAGDNADSAQIGKSLDMMSQLGVTIFVEKGDSDETGFRDYIKPHYFEMRELETVIKNAKRIIS